MDRPITLIAEPPTLEGRHVRLVPLALEHLEGLCEVGLDEDLWRLTTAQVRTPGEMRDYIEAALEERRRGAALPFVTVHRATGRVVGSTRFSNVAPAHRRVEIGSTWIARPWQRTAVNTEAKYLMLRHAFEEMRCIRVELKTDVLNLRSRQAILRLGATEEGTLRRHMVTATGRVRDTVYYSVLDDEWPRVGAALLARLGARAPG